MDPFKIVVLDWDTLIGINLKTGAIETSANCDAFSQPFISRNNLPINKIFFDD
jgi:hypothetical protein